MRIETERGVRPKLYSVDRNAPAGAPDPAGDLTIPVERWLRSTDTSATHAAQNPKLKVNQVLVLRFGLASLLLV